MTKPEIAGSWLVTSHGAAIVTDVLPPDTTFVSACCGGVFDGDQVTWDLGTLVPDDCVELTMEVTADVVGMKKETAAVEDGAAMKGMKETREMKETKSVMEATADAVVHDADAATDGAEASAAAVTTDAAAPAIREPLRW